MYCDVHSLGNNHNVIQFLQIINNLVVCFNCNETPVLGFNVFQQYLVTHIKLVQILDTRV